MRLESMGLMLREENSTGKSEYDQELHGRGFEALTRPGARGMS